MHELKIDLTPKIKNLVISSIKGISGSSPGQGAFSRSAGERRAVLFRGKGLEFEKFRQFTSDDDARMIDWKASLRSNKLLVKTYSEEQNKDIIFLMDVSSSMTFGSTPKLKCEYAAELVANIAFNVVQEGDNAGLVMFNDHLVKVIPPLSGIGQYYKITNTLLNAKLYEGKFDFVKAMSQFFGTINRAAIIIILSDFIGLKGEWKRILESAAIKLELVGIMIRDPLDDKLPNNIGQVVLSDPFSDSEAIIDPNRIAKQYEKINAEQIKEIQNVFKKIKSDLLILHTNENFKDPLKKFFMG